MTPTTTITIWMAYYPDGSDYALFGSEIEALRHAVRTGMQVGSQRVEMLTGHAVIEKQSKEIKEING